MAATTTAQSNGLLIRRYGGPAAFELGEIEEPRPGHGNVLVPSIRVFERASRTIAPSPDAWHRSGDLLSDAKQEGLEIARVSKAFANDILLALSCRESAKEDTLAATSVWPLCPTWMAA